MSVPMISVVSPVYGCRDCLAKLAERVTAAFEGTSLTWELVLVDDRAPDTPWPLIEDLAAKDARIRGVRLARNHGQHLAIWAGLAEARGDHIAVIDCDLQDDPNVIPDLHADIIASGTEAVIVNRGSWSDSRLRRASSNILRRLMKSLTGVHIQNIGNFGIYSRRMVDTLLQFKEQEVFLPIMVTLSGLETKEFHLDRGKRFAGESSYSFLKLFTLAAAVIVRFTDRPLILSAFFGIAVCVLSMIVSVLLVIIWATADITVPGWTSSILSIWFLSGLVMATLGIHGLYIGRIFREVQNRPRILIERCTDPAKPKTRAGSKAKTG